jgi:ornithine cyclodeaminase/alanine dehydrogenase-like protein (mu-crystallin family)
MPLLLLNEDELRQIVTINEAIDSIEVAFTALGRGQLDVPGDFALQLPNVKGEVQVKGTYFHDTPYFVIKVRNDFYNNLTLNLPIHNGLTAVFDATTGFPAAIMIDNGYLASIRRPQCRYRNHLVD